MWDQESRALLSSHAPFALVRLDASGEVVAAGGGLVGSVGSADENGGRALLEALDGPAANAVVTAALNGEPGTCTVRLHSQLLDVTARPTEGSGALVLLTYAADAAMRAELTRHEADLQRFAALVELSRDFIAMADLDGRVTYLNRAGRDLVGLDADEEVLGRPTTDYFTAAGNAKSVEIEEAVRSHGFWEGESELHHFPTGGSIPVSVNSFLVTHPAHGEPLAMATVQRDLRQRVESERALALSVSEQRHLAALGRMAAHRPLSGLAAEVVDRLADRFEGLVPAVLALDAGVLRPFAVGGTEDLSEVVPESSTSLLWRAIREESSLVVAAMDAPAPRSVDLPSGVVRAAVVCPVPAADRIWGVIAVLAPVEREWSDRAVAFVESVCATFGAAVRRAELEEKLEHQALHDVLTGLPNRALAHDRMESALQRARRHDTRVAVLLLDLDDFKGVNDSQGHDAGDRLLVALADRLQAVLPQGDTVARLGGDEFVVICEDVTGPEQVVEIAGRLMVACAQPVEVDGQVRELTTSIGVTTADGTADPGTLLTEADIAMYRAKREHPGSLRFFDETMRAEVLDKVALSADLRAAIAERRIDVWYQPIVELGTGHVVALEALARWHNGDEHVSPASFVQLAEEIGIVGELGALVLEKALDDAAEWQAWRPDVALRVNASAYELRDPSYADRVERLRRAAGVPAGLLGIEMTETTLVDEGKHTLENIQRINDLGIALLVDDFGTGYSSLGYLQRFPDIDVLKIDRAFLQDEVRGAPIISALIGLGRAFGFTLCAEGVETETQRATLTEMGCELAQGFLFAKPAPADDLPDLLARLG